MKAPTSKKARIFYARTDEFWLRGEKYRYLEENEHRGNIAWRDLEPDAKHNWLLEGKQDEYQAFISIADPEKSLNTTDKKVLFDIFSNGVQTNRDNWVFNFNDEALSLNIKRIIDTYNEQVFKWHTQRRQGDTIDSFVLSDEKKIKWSSRLKECLAANKSALYDENKIRKSLYRPFTFQYLYFDQILNHRRGRFPLIFPISATEGENKIICISGPGHDVFRCLIADCLVEQKFSNSANGNTQCFPFYTYDEDGSNRRENITDWALENFRGHYSDKSISKWDIFHYVYGVLHHPVYREGYAANLKRELPRIPFAPSVEGFRALAEAGARLAEIHVNYEQQPEYPLERIESAETALDWRVEKMRLSKDKSTIVYNDFLTLAGIPAEAFEYRLGNRSALEWVIDQYQITTDRRSSITNDPNRPDDPQYILRLIGQVITVSLETVKIVRNLPNFGFSDEDKA